MAANETRVHFRPGAQPTGRATAGVLARRFVTTSGSRDALLGENLPIKPAVAAGYAIGVPAHDQVTGKTVAIYAGSGYHVRVQCSAAIDASNGPVAVEVATGGKVVTRTSGVIVGYALSTTSAADQDAEIRLV